MTDEDIIDIVDAIHSGQFDDQLAEIHGAVMDRRKAVASATFHDLRVGDTVRITNASKKYLTGATAKVIEKRVTKVTIEFPDDMGQYDPYNKFAGKRWIFPPAALEKVEE